MKKKPAFQLTYRSLCILIPTLILSLELVLLPGAKAVGPPPDGGYAGGNTAEGQSALLSLTSGTYNTGLGVFSLLSLSGGNLNTATGAGTLLANTADENTATGAGALLNNTVGAQNTANGAFALFSNTTGSQNIAIGFSALLNNTTGDVNIAIGEEALLSNVIGGANIANGAFALHSNTDGNNNTATGASALFHNTTGSFNTADGDDALLDNTVGNSNTAVGIDALSGNSTGNNNVGLGFLAGASVTTANNVICIGASVGGANVDDTCFIGNIFGMTSSGGIGVFVNESGQLGTLTSSRRFKDDIKPMDRTSESILALRPVTFHYKKEIDPKGIPQFGLVAEDVEKVNPDLVIRDKEGKPYSVRYDQVNAMLLNEFLKEHRKIEEQDRKIQEQETTIAQLKEEMESVIANTREQDSRIQRVSDQLQPSNLTPRTAGRIRSGGPAPQLVTSDQ